MEFMEVIRQRKSIRSYRNDAIPEQAFACIREAVKLSPTACNRQPFKVIFLTGPDQKKELVDRLFPRWQWIAEAPVVAVIAGNYAECWKRLEGNAIADVDCAIVMEHLVLAAADQGLGSCWICAFDRAEADRVLGLSADWKSVMLTPLGYPASPLPERPPRKHDDQLFEVR